MEFEGTCVTLFGYRLVDTQPPYSCRRLPFPGYQNGSPYSSSYTLITPVQLDMSCHLSKMSGFGSGHMGSNMARTADERKGHVPISSLVRRKMEKKTKKQN